VCVALLPVVPFVFVCVSLLPVVVATASAWFSFRAVFVAFASIRFSFTAVFSFSAEAATSAVVEDTGGSFCPAVDWVSAFPEIPRVVSFLSYILAQRDFLHKFAVENRHERYQTSKPVFTRYKA
jgi:hypothetical protein